MSALQGQNRATEEVSVCDKLIEEYSVTLWEGTDTDSLLAFYTDSADISKLFAYDNNF